MKFEQSWNLRLSRRARFLQCWPCFMSRKPREWNTCPALCWHVLQNGCLENPRKSYRMIPAACCRLGTRRKRMARTQNSMTPVCSSQLWAFQSAGASQHFQQTSMQEFQVQPYQRLAYGALDFAKTPVQLLLVSWKWSISMIFPKIHRVSMSFTYFSALRLCRCVGWSWGRRLNVGHVGHLEPRLEVDQCALAHFLPTGRWVLHGSPSAWKPWPTEKLGLKP